MDECMILDAAIAEHMAALPMKAASGGAGALDAGTVRQILDQFRQATGLGVFRAIGWIPLVIELLIRYGPEIADLAARVVKVVQDLIDAFNQGLTPATFRVG